MIAIPEQDLVIVPIDLNRHIVAKSSTMTSMSVLVSKCGTLMGKESLTTQLPTDS